MGEKVEIFTDGACRGNPGPGGWGVILRYQGNEKELNGAEPDTTNNRMELLAAIMAIESLTRPCEVSLTTDSEYVKNGITQWLKNWKLKNWKTANKKPVKNMDLWQRLDAQKPRNAGAGAAYVGNIIYYYFKWFSSILRKPEPYAFTHRKHF